MVDPCDLPPGEDDEQEMVENVRPLTFGGLLRRLARMGTAATPARPVEVKQATAGQGTPVDEDAAVLSLIKDVSEHITKKQLARMKRIMGVKA